MRALLLAALLAAGSAHAHKPSDSYLTLFADGHSVHGQWDIALRDLEYAVGLDADGDGAITWGELKAKHAEIDAYALARLALRADGAACELQPAEHLVDEHSDGAYAVLRFAARCPAESFKAVAVEYSLFFDLDPTHRGLLRVERNGDTTTGILSPERPSLEVSAEGRSRLHQFADYVREGVWHIWIGFDHILFLVSLLLPSVFILANNQWAPANRFRDTFWDVFKVATSFTVAHSITLSLAALSVITLPSRLVESMIALSIVLVALNNIVGRIKEGSLLVVLCLGLFHGLGFAAVMGYLPVRMESLLRAVVGFNVGVEVGQMAIVASIFPILFLLRNRPFYVPAVLKEIGRASCRERV